jgi:hypothetical protein
MLKKIAEYILFFPTFFNTLNRSEYFADEAFVMSIEDNEVTGFVAVAKRT